MGEAEHGEPERCGEAEAAPQDLLGAELLHGHLGAEVVQAPPNAAEAADPALDALDEVTQDRPQDPLEGGERRQCLLLHEKPGRSWGVPQVRREPAVQRRAAPERNAGDDQREAAAAEQADAEAGRQAHRRTRRSSGSLATRSMTRYATNDTPPPTASTPAPAGVL